MKQIKSPTPMIVILAQLAANPWVKVKLLNGVERAMPAMEVEEDMKPRIAEAASL